MFLYNKTTGQIEATPSFLMGKSQEELRKYGMYPVHFGGEPDNRFYTSEQTRSFNEALQVYEITYNAFPKDVAVIKSEMISEVKSVQAKLLSEIDWYWLREMKTGEVVPQTIKDYAVAVYSTASTKETEITAFTTIHDLEQYRKNPQEVTYIDDITGETKTGVGYTDLVQSGWPIKQ